MYLDYWQLAAMPFDPGSADEAFYFPGEALNEKDGVLNRVPRAEWSKVIGKPAAGAAGAPTSFWFEATIAKA